MSIDAAPTAQKLSARMAAEIRAEMARQRISGRQIALKVGRSANWVSLKTSGTHRLDFEDAETFAAALGVPLLDLLRRASTYAYDDVPVLLTTEPALAGVGASTLPTRRVGSPLANTYPTGRRPPGHPGRRGAANGPRHAARTGR